MRLYRPTASEALYAACLVLMSAAALLVAACGGSDGDRAGGVTIEALTPTATASPAIGAKGIAPTPSPRPTAAVEAATEEPRVDPPSSDAATPSAATPEPSASSSAPTSGRWIDVDVTRYAVRLMDGDSTLREIAPVAVGEAIDTGDFTSTQTGLFHVYVKSADLTYDPPYDTFISDWVGFDPDKANGFHSFLKDADGKIVDASTGRVSNGCIRTADAEAVYAFAEVGMPVFVHW